MPIWPEIAERITAATGEPFELRSHRAVAGGCINTAYVLEAGARRYFVKTNRASGLEMFEAEADGLAELHRAGAVRVPSPIFSGVAADTAFLVMEYLPLGRSGAGAAERLGRRLADLHRTTAPRYGWHRDNTIGSTPQVNTQSGAWIDFWRERRLGSQLDLAARKGHGGRLQRAGERLMADLDAFFAGHDPEPSLLHGDLWSGNYAADESGEPVIYDPAVYYGDREADLAMTELFGGFPQAFYGAYRDAWPLDAGYRVRRTVYNLYHVLNHLNLFGGGYGAQAQQMMDSLISEIR
jgi:protein-ribulosamine 3-kinase